MAKQPISYIDELTDLPKAIKTTLCEDPCIVGLILNKPFDEVTDDDKDICFDRYMFDYSFVPNTVTSTEAFVFIETEMQDGDVNQNIIESKVFITVVCHKDFMELNSEKYPGIAGNRRDNIGRFIDMAIQATNQKGARMNNIIGDMRFESTSVLSSYNNFVFREIVYDVANFHFIGDHRDVPGLSKEEDEDIGE